MQQKNISQAETLTLEQNKPPYIILIQWLSSLFILNSHCCRGCQRMTYVFIMGVVEYFHGGSFTTQNENQMEAIHFYVKISTSWPQICTHRTSCLQIDLKSYETPIKTSDLQTSKCYRKFSNVYTPYVKMLAHSSSRQILSLIKWNLKIRSRNHIS